MSASSQEEEGNEELLSDHGEEESEKGEKGEKEGEEEEEEEKVDGSPPEIEEGETEEKENGVVAEEEAVEKDEVVVKKSSDDATTEEHAEEMTDPTTDGATKRKSVDSVKVTEETKEEDSVGKPEVFAVESIEEVAQKTDKRSSGLFPRELLMNSEAVSPEVEDLPKASSEAMKFFCSITEEDLERVMFKDSLITTSDEGDLGEFLISIEKCTFQEEDCFCISAKSVGAIEGILCGTSLIAYVDRNLQTIEQRHHEYVELNKCPLDRKTLITRKDGLYKFTKTISEGEATQQVQKAWNIKDLPILMLEGSNTLFLRLLITKGTAVMKEFFVPTLDSDGYLCSSEYDKLDMKNILINKESVATFGLQRTIFSKMDSPISWNYHFMDDGHLLSRTQIDSHVRMRVTTVPVRLFSHSGTVNNKPVFKKKPINLDEDMEMRSKFIDKKDKFMNDFSVYLRQKPEIRSLLADFLQFLLLRKPDDVVKFAAEYFSSFSTHLVQPPTFQTTRSSVFAQNAPLFKKL